jgi:HlyD family secretion protein
MGLAMASCGNGHGDFDASGIFEATEVLVSAEASGRLVEFTVQEGAELSSGAQVGFVDTTQLFLKKEQLVASVGVVASRRIDVNRQIAALRQQVETQRGEQARFENLVKSNAATRKQLDDVSAQLAVLERQLAAQQELLENSNNGVGKERASLAVQAAQLDDLIRKSIVLSPLKGTALTKYAEAGELVQPGSPLFKVANLERLFLRAYITSAQLQELKIGQPVGVYIDWNKDERRYSGVVSWVSDKAEFTPKTIQTKDERVNLVYAVKIAVENDGYLKRGMYADVLFNDVSQRR